MRVLLSLLALLLTLTACGTADGDSGDDNGDDTTPQASADVLEDVELVDDLGCAFGFAKADAEGEVLLRLHFDERDGAQVPQTVELPDPAWRAYVEIGHHLTRNWCSDVIEEPQREVVEEWQIVEGTLTFDGSAPPADITSSSPEEVTATLTGVVVESPDGERVELGDVELSNTLWGFYAG